MLKTSQVPNKNENTNNVITVENLSIYYDLKEFNETLVLKDFNYKFEKGKIYFIIGNSGSGKTTLVSHFNGLLKSSFGDIYVNNLKILGAKKKIRRFKELRKNVGMVLQFPEYQLFKDTIEKDIMFGPVNLGVKKEEAKAKAKKYLNELDLPDEYLQRSPFGLSGGQKRRVAIAGILAIEPKIFIFDEPTAGLDPNGEREMLNIITNLKKQGKTIIVITHVMDQVLELADEVLLLNGKKLYASGKPYEIYTNKKILQETDMTTPRVISVINELIKLDKNYEFLLNEQPRNVNELANAIIKHNKSKKGKE